MKKSASAASCAAVWALPGPGLAERNQAGDWQGFAADICRVVAAAALGQASAVTLFPLEGEEAAAALRKGDLDLVALGYRRLTGFSGSSDLRFTALALVDGLSLMVADRVYSNAPDLDGRSICADAADEDLSRLESFAATNALNFALMRHGGSAAAAVAFFAGDCQALAGRRLELAGLRAGQGGQMAGYDILPEVFSREHFGPLVRTGDSDWLDIVTWSVFAVIEAEERAIDSRNVEERAKSKADPAVQRFLGQSGNLGRSIGLAPGWTRRAIAQVGNYAEIYDRHFGPGTELSLPRGPNALWFDGGLLQAPAFQ